MAQTTFGLDRGPSSSQFPTHPCSRDLFSVWPLARDIHLEVCVPVQSLTYLCTKTSLVCDLWIKTRTWEVGDVPAYFKQLAAKAPIPFRKNHDLGHILGRGAEMAKLSPKGVPDRVCIAPSWLKLLSIAPVHLKSGLGVPFGPPRTVSHAPVSGSRRFLRLGSLAVWGLSLNPGGLRLNMMPPGSLRAGFHGQWNNPRRGRCSPGSRGWTSCQPACGLDVRGSPRLR